MAEKKRITIERTFRAPIEDVWDLWTTKDGIESWWGPEGFQVTVKRIDLRPGGELLYAMTATAPEQVAFMKQAGMPLSTELLITYTEVVAPRRLAYTNLVAFIPGVEAYENGLLLELAEVKGAVRMMLTIDAMHDELWTQRAVMGWESELGKLAKVIEKRSEG